MGQEGVKLAYIHTKCIDDLFCLRIPDPCIGTRGFTGTNCQSNERGLLNISKL